MLRTDNNGFPGNGHGTHQYHVADAGRDFTFPVFHGVQKKAKPMITKIMVWLFYSTGASAFLLVWLDRLAFISLGDVKEILALAISGAAAITGAMKVIPSACSKMVKLYFEFHEKLEQKRRSRLKDK